ncbi:hypothetical protein M3M35_07305 [Fructilactobacillus myrtifloralis]|uniref:Uncharacterized protein n=1 Tax=Fructilactobacillus myrtifloralis TaxID=2940301 RepID=A0ABY5BRT8_9LACO|nr:hypothetical protein [Fructilactobacillus myrtifloralis]USS85089.1 hypothetical protein M3M35_07305 [Fructilactobacillus myrtifloralis]
MNYDFNHIKTEDTNDLSYMWIPLATIVDGVRHGAYGIDVREYIARGFESVASQMTLLNAAVARVNSKIETVENQLTEVVAGRTIDGEVKKARVDVEGNVYKDLGTRINQMELSSVTSDIKVGTSEFDKTTLWIENIDDPDSEIEFVDVGHDENDPGMPVGIETIQAKDIELDD